MGYKLVIGEEEDSKNIQDSQSYDKKIWEREVDILIFFYGNLKTKMRTFEGVFAPVSPIGIALKFLLTLPHS